MDFCMLLGGGWLQYFEIKSFINFAIISMILSVFALF